jgi:signal transduction histidine kinase
METNGSTLELPSSNCLPPVFARSETDAIRACKILIIDDELPNVRLLERVLKRAGFDNFISTTDSREAATLFTEFQPDIVLTDWLMPEVDGCVVIERVRALMAAEEYLPIVVLTADATTPTKKRALTAGATDFLTKPFDQMEIVLRMQNLLRARLAHIVIQGQKAALEESVRRRTIELERALSELRRTQQQVIQQERLAALGTMAGGIAHDFNNSLCVIMGFSEVLLRDLEKGLLKEKTTEALTNILAAAEDGAKIVHRLRAFYHPEETQEQRIPVDLNQLIEQAVLLTRPRWQTEATAAGLQIMITTKPGEIPAVTGDPAQLREILTNLIFNAIDALPQGGTITLGTSREGDAVALKIKDSGTGMSEEVRQHCLEPFFTTKGKRGTGLGLSMVFGIVQSHNGSVDIQSELGKGTIFTLRLPIAEGQSGTAAGVLSWATRPLHVLVVDDQPLLSQFVCEHLRHDLHTVDVALSGSDALEKLRASDFDLVITDHVMAEMTGEQLAARIREFDSKIPVILLTGYAGDSTIGKQDSPAVSLVLKKPLSQAALRHALAKVMTLSENRSLRTGPSSKNN